jgi:hypothetical protein
VKDISHKKAYVRIMIAFPHEIGLASVSWNVIMAALPNIHADVIISTFERLSMLNLFGPKLSKNLWKNFLEIPSSSIERCCATWELIN